MCICKINFDARKNAIQEFYMNHNLQVIILKHCSQYKTTVSCPSLSETSVHKFIVFRVWFPISKGLNFYGRGMYKLFTSSLSQRTNQNVSTRCEIMLTWPYYINHFFHPEYPGCVTLQLSCLEDSLISLINLPNNFLPRSCSAHIMIWKVKPTKFLVPSNFLGPDTPVKLGCINIFCSCVTPVETLLILFCFHIYGRVKHITRKRSISSTRESCNWKLFRLHPNHMVQMHSSKNQWS